MQLSHGNDLRWCDSLMHSSMKERARKFTALRYALEAGTAGAVI